LSASEPVTHGDTTGVSSFLPFNLHSKFSHTIDCPQ
jgi:hypothetical protein